MATINGWRKSAPIDDPHATFTSPDGSWEYRVLKAYAKDDNAPYARWLCAVRSPFTFGDWEIGDTYVTDVTRGTVGTVHHERLVEKVTA